MANALEIVHFRVAPENVDTLLATRGEALAAVRSRHPGLLSAHLARVEEDRWVDVVLWESLEQARAAAAGAMEIPEFARWCENIAVVASMEHATVHDASPLPVSAA